MLELNSTTSDLGLADLVQAFNNREITIHGGGSDYQRLFGRQPLLNLPILPRTLTDEEKAYMISKMEAYRDKFRLDVKNTARNTFNIVDKMLIFNTKNGCFSERGMISNFEPAPDSYGHRHYTVDMERGG